MSHALHYGTDPTCTCGRRTDLWSPWGALIWSVRRATLKIQDWIQRSRQRQALHDLDDRQLRDIGLSREAAMREASKPFWM